MARATVLPVISATASAAASTFFNVDSPSGQVPSAHRTSRRARAGFDEMQPFQAGGALVGTLLSERAELATRSSMRRATLSGLPQKQTQAIGQAHAAVTPWRPRDAQ